MGGFRGWWWNLHRRPWIRAEGLQVIGLDGMVGDGWCYGPIIGYGPMLVCWPYTTEKSAEPKMQPEIAPKSV